jgi:hypothetical protein
MQDLKMHCLCYVGKEPKRIQYDQHNIMCGSINYTWDDVANLQSRGYVMDHYGEHISHMNGDFGSLTGLFWVWKNSSSPYKGINTYRIFWDEDFVLKDNRIYVPEVHDVYISARGPKGWINNVYDHFSHCHNNLGWQLLYGLAGDANIPITIPMIEQLKTHRYLTPFHMCIAKEETFNKICEILFQVLFEFHANYQFALAEIHRRSFGQTRFYDFFAERLFHIIVTNHHYFLGNVDVTQLKVLDINHYA